MEMDKLVALGKKLLWKVGKKVIIIAAIILIIAGAAYSVILNDGGYKDGDKSNTSYVAKQKINENVSQEKIVASDDGYKYDFDLDQMVDEIIDELNQNDGRLSTYIKTIFLKEYIKTFIKAEIITSYPDLRSVDKIGTATAENEFQGCIQIQKALSDGTIQKLSYIDYATFSSYVNSGNSEANNHFSLNSDENLVVTGWTRTTTNITSNIPGVENISDKEEYTLTEKVVKYKNVVSSYSMPFEFLWALTVCGDDAEFAYEVAKLALNSKIVLTVQENFSTSETTVTEEYKTQDEIRKSATLAVKIKDDIFRKNYEDITTEDPVSYKTETKTKVESSSVQINITEADTWILKYVNTVNNNIIGTTEIVGEPDIRDDTDYEFVENYPLTSDFINKVEDELENYIKSLCEDKDETIESGASNQRIQKYSKKIDQITSYNSTYSSNKYELGTATITEKTDKQSETENFVTLFIKYRTARTNILDAYNWLFAILETNENTANMVDLVKYLLYKATDINYGTTSYDFSLFEQGSFETIGGSVQNLSSYLRQFSHSGEAPKSNDGNYYMMYGDGVGWPTIGEADIQWKSHYSKFDKAGKIIHNGVEKEVESVSAYIEKECLKKGVSAEYSDEEVSAMQIGIEKSLVDDIGNTIQEVYYDKVVEATSGINLTRQQLYALVAVEYNFGYLPVRNNKTFAQIYLETKDKYGENTWEQNKEIWDNWWSALGGGAAGHIPARDAAFETYIKGIFDFSQSDAGTVFNRKYYIYYTKAQLSKFSYAPSKTVTRTSANEEEIFTMDMSMGIFEADSTDSKVKGYYKSTTGRVFTVLNQTTIPGWGDKCNRAAAAIIASGYSSETSDQLIDTINTNKARYKWDSVPTDNYFNSYGLKLDETKVGNVSANDTATLLRKQLSKGGYAMIWLNNGGTYIGKSGKTWTSKYHWVAVVDYRMENGNEQIMVLDWHGGAWYSIDEFQYGIADYALISEK